MDIRRVLAVASELFVPRLCKVCGRSLGSGEGPLLCLDCFVKLPRTSMHTAPTASRGLNAVQERLADGPPLLLAGAWFYYSRNSPYAALVRGLKYHGRPSWGVEMGRAYCEELLADIPDLASRVEVFLPVGMHWRKEMSRGYNQSERIARGMGEASGIPIGDNLTAIRSHATQTRRSAEERRRNVNGIFHVEHPHEIEGLNVAIVDDIVTTGSTAAEAARALLDAGAASVSLFAIGLANS